MPDTETLPLDIGPVYEKPCIAYSIILNLSCTHEYFMDVVCIEFYDAIWCIAMANAPVLLYSSAPPNQ
jgi:hypothetical protein